MQKLFLSLTLMIALIIPAIKAKANSNEDLIERTLKGQEMIFSRNYDEAKTIFEALLRDYPNSPAGDFGLMAMTEMKMLEREDFSLETEFLLLSKQGKNKVNRVMAMQRPEVWDIFLSGSLLGVEGLFMARKGKWLPAYTAGTKSRQLFKRVKEMDPTFVDADFGLGMYIYWRSVFTHDLWFLRMLPDKRVEGMTIVENVAKNGHLAKDLARVNLAVMYFEEKRYTDAKVILDDYLSKYENNVILRTILGRVLVAEKNYTEAVAAFKKVLSVDPTMQKSHYFIGVTIVMMSTMPGVKANLDEAKIEFEKFLQFSNSNHWKASAHYWLGRLAEIKKEADTAKAEYAKAYELNPKLGDANNRMRALGSGL